MSDRWLEKYVANFPSYELAAKAAEIRIAEALHGRVFDIHAITGRAKDPDSAAEKISRRKYGNPALQFDDLIGVRIITLYEHTVPVVAQRLRDRFEVNAKRSANKSARLRSREVGYRSDHLVLKIPRLGEGPDLNSILAKTFVEVQVRSVVSHAWAEIEHSLRYKSGIELPAELSRRFDALAGTLELVDREFSAIETSLVEIIHEMTKKMEARDGMKNDLTPVSLLAALAAFRPDMDRLGPRRLALPIEDAYRATKDLKEAGILTVQDFESVLASPELKSAILRYSNARGDVDPSNVSAIVVLGAVVGIKSPAQFSRVRRFQLDPDLVDAIAAYAT
ncbi:MAG TPA: hypothetical protein VHZ81_04625 [Galbitalea sp.]|nr:hypothetical protein [Galbitalea sp.]